MPVKLSDDLVKLARKEAGAADRSITSQIEHWAKLGRAVESALGHVDVLALKVARGDLMSAFPGLPERQAAYAVLQQVAATADRSELAQALRHGRAVYQSDPAGSGLIMRVDPNDHRTLGHLEKRRFVSRPKPRRRVRR
jgi:hypothetical protein